MQTNRGVQFSGALQKAVRLIRLEFRHQNPQEAQSNAEKMAEKISYWISEGKFKQTDIIGPVPCFYPKLNAVFRWQIILRGPQPTEVLRGKELGDTVVTVDPVSLL